MTPRQLTYFIEIAQARSFTRAAAILHIAQPALSRQVQQLEDELGVELFKRSDSGVTLTDAGELLRGKALALLEQFKRVKDDLASLSAQPRGRLHVGLPPSMFELVTAPLVRSYLGRFPQVALEITEGTSASLNEMVLSGRLDVAVVSSIEPRVAVSRQLLLRERLYVVGACGNPWLKERNSLRVKHLDGIPLVLTQRPNAMRMILDEAFSAAGVKGQILLESSSTRLALSLVEAGTACAVLPYCAVAAQLEAGRLVAVPVEDLEVSWVLAHSRDRALTAAAEIFRQMIVDEANARFVEGRWPGMLNMA